jgi:uncharacterized protein YndB with AHSA1/START domain
MKIEFIREIEAPKDVVWSVIADFAAYAEWNPFVVACSSELRVGAPMAMTVRLGDRQREQVEFVSRVVEGELFEYRMKPVGPLLHSYRQHEVASQADGRTLYRSTFELNGWLAPLVGAILSGPLHDGFKGMTDSLVSRSEQLVLRQSIE